MGLDVTYKGDRIATVGPLETKTLTTADKYCEDDITLTNHENPVAEENDVIFIDYDGTIRYSYSAEDFLALTELPSNPSHDGLIAQGWNWTLADAQGYVRKYGIHVIGQSYTTVTGATEFDIETFDGLFITIHIYQSKASGVLIDFGDGSEAQRVATSGNIAVNHIYSTEGLKTITLLPNEDCTIAGIQQQLIIGDTVVAMSRILAVRIGRNFPHFNWNSFYRFYSLESISIPTTFIGNNWRELNATFQYCYSLNALVFPIDRNIAFSDCSIHSCYALKYISLPKSTSTMDYRMLYQAYHLRALCIPEGWNISSQGYHHSYACSLRKLSLGSVPIVYSNDFANAQSLEKLFLPATIERLNASCFSNAYSMKELRFAGETPPTIANANAFSSLASLCRILIPVGSLASYLAATNYPAPATYIYLGFATFESGTTLPIQDSTEAYSLVWYASKADAVAEINPIVVGNGKEIYCRYAAIETEGGE